MLTRQKNIDYISTADVGEFAFVEFIRYLCGEKRIDQVPRLLYRDGQNNIIQNDLPELPETGTKFSLDAMLISAGLETNIAFSSSCRGFAYSLDSIGCGSDILSAS